MNGLRRCAYWRISRPPTMTAPKAALRRGLIGTEGGVGTAPPARVCADRVERGTKNSEPRTKNPELRRKLARRTANSSALRRLLDVKFLGLVGALHDEPE